MLSSRQMRRTVFIFSIEKSILCHVTKLCTEEIRQIILHSQLWIDWHWFHPTFQLSLCSKQWLSSTFMDYFTYYKVKILGMQHRRDGFLVLFFNTIAVFAVLWQYCTTPICCSFLGQFLENIAVQTIQFHCCWQ